MVADKVPLEVVMVVLAVVEMVVMLVRETRGTTLQWKVMMVGQNLGQVDVEEVVVQVELVKKHIVGEQKKRIRGMMVGQEHKMIIAQAQMFGMLAVAVAALMMVDTMADSQVIKLLLVLELGVETVQTVMEQAKQVMQTQAEAEAEAVLIMVLAEKAVQAS
tara:strand:- start:32 stop:514 length:483 start_codon:yes stop_codon:yes gene_type:complete